MNFLHWQEIVIWVNYNLKKFPNLNKIQLGETYESREIMVLKISNGPRRPGVFIMGGEQGRDRMSVMVILNFIDQILTTKNYNELTNIYDLYFMPVFNPDGYEHSLSIVSK